MRQEYLKHIEKTRKLKNSVSELSLVIKAQKVRIAIYTICITKYIVDSEQALIKDSVKVEKQTGKTKKSLQSFFLNILNLS